MASKAWLAYCRAHGIDPASVPSDQTPRAFGDWLRARIEECPSVDVFDEWVEGWEEEPSRVYAEQGK